MVSFLGTIGRLGFAAKNIDRNLAEPQTVRDGWAHGERIVLLSRILPEPRNIRTDLLGRVRARKFELGIFDAPDSDLRHLAPTIH